MKMAAGQVVHDLVEHMNHAQIVDRILGITQEMILLITIINIMYIAYIMVMFLVVNIVSLLNMLATNHPLKVHGHHPKKERVLLAMHPRFSIFINLHKTVVYVVIKLRYDFH